MNDDQTLKLLRVLAEAFDRAAMTCSTKEHAARHILATVKSNGFKVEPRKMPDAATDTAERRALAALRDAP